MDKFARMSGGDGKSNFRPYVDGKIITVNERLKRLDGELESILMKVVALSESITPLNENQKKIASTVQKIGDLRREHSNQIFTLAQRLDSKDTQDDNSSRAFVKYMNETNKKCSDIEKRFDDNARLINECVKIVEDIRDQHLNSDVQGMLLQLKLLTSRVLNIESRLRL